MEAAGEHEEGVPALELDLHGQRGVLGEGDAVVPEVGAGDEAGGAVVAGAAGVGDEEAHGGVAAQRVFFCRGLEVVLDDVVTVEPLAGSTGEEAEGDGVVELGLADAVLDFVANLREKLSCTYNQGGISVRCWISGVRTWYSLNTLVRK